uniref:Uncharacterized protein n=1 Tax=Populus trichocarpa TaxID=3694 RepID=A0A2K1YG57_POPTR
MPCRYKLACVINLFPSFSLCHQSFSKFYCHSEKICSTSQIWRGLSFSVNKFNSFVWFEKFCPSLLFFLMKCM